MHHRKLFSLAIVFFTLLLVACGSSPPAASPAPSTAPAAANPPANSLDPSKDEVTLRFAVLGQQAEEDNIKRILTGFNKKYPNIHVTIEQQSGDYFQKIGLMASSNTLPDLLWVHDQGVADLAKKGQLLNLDPMIQGSKLDTSNFVESMFALGKFNGHQYMFPRDYNHLVTFYNVNMFKAAGVALPKDGWTWDEMVAAARKLTKKDASGKVLQYGIDGSNFNWWAIDVPAIRGFGGDVIGGDGKPVVNSKAAAQGMAALADLIKEGVASPLKGVDNAFISGQAAMWFHVRPLVSPINDGAKGKWDWNVATFPKFPGAGKVGTGTSGYAISANTKHKNEAWALLSYIDSEDGQRLFNSTGNGVPVLKSLKNDASWRSAPRADINHDAFFEFPEWDTLPIEIQLPAGAGPAIDTARNDLFEKLSLGSITADQFTTQWADAINKAIQDAK